MCMCICVQKVRIYSSSIPNTLSRGAGWDCLRRRCRYCRRQQLNMSMRAILKCAFISFVNKPHTAYYNTMTHVSIGRMIGWGSLVLLTLIGRPILSIHMYVLLVLETTRRIFLSNASSSSHVFTPNSFSHSIRSLSLYLSTLRLKFIFPPRIFNGCLWRLVEIWMLLMQGLSRQQKQRIGFSSFRFVLNCIHFIYLFVSSE